jgi:hypothetical protein
MQLSRYFVSQYSKFCRHNPLCCFSTSVYFCKHIFRYRLSPETFGYTLVCYWGYQIKANGVSDACSTGRIYMRNAYKISVGKCEGKRPPRRPRHRWEDNIRMDLKEIRWEYVDLIYLAQDRDQLRALVNTAMNFLFP